MAHKLDDDANHYRYYMNDETAELPSEIPPSAAIDLPPLTPAEEAATTPLFPYREFCSFLERIVLSENSRVVLDPWKLWSALDPKQRLRESSESAVTKALRRVHSGLTYTIGAPGSAAIPMANAPLRVYRGAICCLASESTHFRSCLRREGEYRGGIPPLVAAGALALVKGSLLRAEENYKRVWLYLNATGDGLAIGRPVYGDWKREELLDAILRVQNTLGLPVLGTFNPETANRLGIPQAPSAASKPHFRTASFTMRPEWRAPYTDGLTVANDTGIRKYLKADSWWPMSIKSAGEAVKASPGGPRVLKVQVRVAGDDTWFLVKEQSFKKDQFCVENADRTTFTFRGASVCSDRFLELRLHNDPPIAYVRGDHESMDNKPMPYRTFDDTAVTDAALLRIMAAIRAYNTNPTEDPVEFIKES